jgi:ubiquinone/menaquinone biosynthesis C-methylase UbiE
VGHWTALVADFCAPDASITAIDREEEWVNALRLRFQTRQRFTALQMDVSDLHGVEGSYDLATCQTLLLHIADVPGVLKQIRGLLVPRGLLLLVEPNNFSNRLAIGSLIEELSPTEYGALAAFWCAFEKGRQRLGFGREWVADFLPKMIVDEGFVDLMIFGNDRVAPRFPPYATEEQSVAIGERFDRDRDDTSEREQARQYVLASGYDKEQFERVWPLVQELDRRERQRLEENTFSTAGDCNLFVFAARNR